MVSPSAGLGLEEIGAAIGVDLKPDENGVVTLTSGGDVTITIEAPDESPFFYFHSPVRRLAGADRAAALEAAMRHNLFGLPLSAAWLGLDAAEDQITLCYSAPREGLHADRFVSTVEALAVAVRELRHAGDVHHRDRSASEMSGGGDYIRI